MSNELINTNQNYNLQEVSMELLEDARKDLASTNAVVVPIGKLASLGAGVSNMVPTFNKVTQTTTVSGSGLYRLANESVGDTLKVAKNGNFWGAFKTAEGKSKFAQLKAADPIRAKSTTLMPIHPATMMMAASLYSIEMQLAQIQETSQEILSFLETEKESEIEADVETLMSMIEKYKFNWDNEQFVSSNHKLVLDIQRTARKNMNTYQKKANDIMHSKKPIVNNIQVDATMKQLLKMFKYYRLCVYAFSLASLVEILLSGDFKEENIACIKKEVGQLSMEYRQSYKECSLYLEKLSTSAIDQKALKGAGTAGAAIGKVIGSIPVVRKGPVDEILEWSGNKLKEGAEKKEDKIISAFAEIANPQTEPFTKKMTQMIQIYNHTDKIYIDKDKIYLIEVSI